jgi:hypothetical protein
MPGAHLLGRVHAVGADTWGSGCIIPIDPNRHVAKLLLLLRVFPGTSMELPTAQNCGRRLITYPPTFLFCRRTQVRISWRPRIASLLYRIVIVNEPLAYAIYKLLTLSDCYILQDNEDTWCRGPWCAI